MKKCTVPSPWTPVESRIGRSEAVISVWGRRYEWKDSLFPVSISTAGREILSSPATLHAVFDGEEKPFEKTFFTVHCEDDEKAVFTVSQTAGDIIVNARFTVEFDGFIECVLSIVPFWGAKPTISGLYIDIPLTKESSELYHLWPAGVSGICVDGQVISSGAVPDGGFSIPFRPYVWCGWEFGGLGVAMESEENIDLNDRSGMISLRDSGSGRLLRYTLLDRTPIAWEGRADSWGDALEPIDYVIGLHPTPVKPMYKDRLGVHILHTDWTDKTDYLSADENGENLCVRLQKQGVNWIIFHEGWSSVQNYGQAVDEEKFSRTVYELHKCGIKVMAYFGYEYATTAPGWHENKYDYLIRNPYGHPTGGWQRLNQCQRDYMVCYAGGYASEMRERVRYAMTHYHLDGIYTDGTYVPWECANPSHGCGYVSPDGVRHSTYPILAVRRHVKELYKLVHGLGGYIDTHQSSCLMAPTLSFADSFFNGESIQEKLKQDFLGFMNLPAYRTEYMGKNLGVFPQLLAYVDERMPIEKAASLSMIHDVMPRPWGEGLAAKLSPYWKELAGFGVSDAVWHPYWLDGPVKCLTENAYCSSYEKDGKLLCVISAFDDGISEVTLDIGGVKHAVPVTPFVPKLAEFDI
ncbi:MAG: hypothetical protein IJT56_06745 [Clostridia bacterium]|nr:hypothetical protein [Clostridia bacterium]